MGTKMGERFQREGTYVYLWLTHVDVWQKPIQYCKTIILQLKIDKFKEKETKGQKTRTPSSSLKPSNLLAPNLLPSSFLPNVLSPILSSYQAGPSRRVPALILSQPLEDSSPPTIPSLWRACLPTISDSRACFCVRSGLSKPELT